MNSAFAVLYALFATLALLLIAPAMPPFQNADEPAHAFRADQLSHGQLLGKNLSRDEGGGKVDGGLREAAARFSAVPFNRAAKVARPMYAPLDWGRPEPQQFSNTAIYPPVFYLPAVMALAGARATGAPVLRGLMAARLATGVVSITIATTAIALADGAAIWLFAMLLLPMAVCLSAAVSQDGPMLACTALAAALCRRGEQAASPRLLAMIAMLLALVAMARPPYAAFALLLVGMNAPTRQRAWSVLFVLAATLGWALLNVHLVHAMAGFTAFINPMAQLRRLVGAPGQIPGLLAHTWHHWGHGLLVGFIGEPGWLDVDLPAFYRGMVWVMLALALGVCVCAMRPRGAAALLVPAAILAACTGIVLLQYLTASLVGDAEIGGLQGRYFLPPALLIAALPLGAAPRWVRPAQAAVLGFPLVSIPVTVHAILLRYYI